MGTRRTAVGGRERDTLFQDQQRRFESSGKTVIVAQSTCAASVPAHPADDIDFYLSLRQVASLPLTNVPSYFEATASMASSPTIPILNARTSYTHFATPHGEPKNVRSCWPLYEVACRYELVAAIYLVMTWPVQEQCHRRR